jgi:urea transporter/murein DD-endopeptidase MepM/ murein hydrolase activator NlpD
MKYWLDSILNSYSQIFYSLNKVLAVTILLVTFFTPHLGLTGLLAIILINVIAHLVGINRKTIEEGLYGFNALLLGLFLGFQYQFNATFWLLFVTAVSLLLVVSVWLNGIFHKHRLPFLSFPFLIVYSVVSLAAGSFSYIHLNEEHVYLLNHLARQESDTFYQYVHFLDNWSIPNYCLIYFKTLAGTFFQTSVFGGVLIAIGILYFSRIAFTLSILGFLSAYFFYSLFGADVNELNINLVGSNFIFMAIGIGCFYIIPNFYSYLTVFLLTPLLLMIMIFLNKTMFVFQLKSFTLAFSIVVTIFLLFLQHRWFHKFLHLVTIQYYSAEKTIYKYITSIHRFKNAHLAKIQLPFWGEWYVSQGYNGKITHLGEWGNALDFVIVDETSQTFQGSGTLREDFYCYNKPVIAPFDGYIYEIINNVEDNEISGVNTLDNWGNTLVMNHLNGLFSQISHFKKDSFKVAVGDYVSKGTVLGTCGNSGRSPEPHIHFQLQTEPKVGAKTLAYPIAYFLEKKRNKISFKISEIPSEETIISNVSSQPLMTESFSLIPGKKMVFKNNETEKLIFWEVFTDAYNRTYLYCKKTKSTAFFVNDGTMFYFYDFEGSKNSELFFFYVAAYRVLLAAYEEITINDMLPLIHFNNKSVLWIQDFLAPFYLFTKTNYASNYTFFDNLLEPNEAVLQSKIATTFLGFKLVNKDFSILLKDKKIQGFEYSYKGKKQTLSCID